MNSPSTSTIAFAVFCVALAAASPVRAERVIHCTSHNHNYNYCRVDTDNHATLEEQLSRSSCRLNSSWGYDRHGVWVDRGCEGRFRVGYNSRHHNYDYRTYDYDDDDHDSKKTAVAAGAAVAGIALIAALASKKDKENNQEVPSWAVGTYEGYDDMEDVNVEVTILPGGSVTGTAGSHHFTGDAGGNKLEIGDYTFQIHHSGNGFKATDVNNSKHEIVFRHSGSGYGTGY